MALPFTEWSREEKDEFAQKRMEAMKLKNEALARRHAEVEQDRMRAEAKDSAVTSLKITRKEKIVIEKEKEEDIPKVTKEREWDKGKIDQDADDWSPPKFYEYRPRAQRRSFPDRRAPKKNENWRVRSANVSKERQSYTKFRSSGYNPKYQDSSNYGSGGFRTENTNFSRQRGRAHRTSSGTYRSFQNSRFDEPRKKSISGGAGSASPSLSDSEVEPVKHQAKPEIERMWQDGGITENQHKQSRVESWVKEVNTSGSWNEDFDDHGRVRDRYVKKAESGSRDTPKNYGYANEEEYPTKAQSTRDPAYLKNRERYDGFKYGQSSRGNSRPRGNHMGERTVGGFENRNQRDYKKKNYGDKNRFRRESDLSDRTSSMKESDYYDCNKDKFNKTTSDSKSSDPDGIWEDYVPKKETFDKPKNNSKSSDPQGIWEDYEPKNRSFDKPKDNSKSSDPQGIWEDYEPTKRSSDKPKIVSKSSDPQGIWEDYEPTKSSFDKPKEDLNSSDPQGIWEDYDQKKESFDKPKNDKNSSDPQGIWEDYDQKKESFDKPKNDKNSSDPQGIWENYDQKKEFFDKFKNDSTSTDPQGIWEDYDQKQEFLDKPKNDSNSSELRGKWEDKDQKKGSFNKQSSIYRENKFNESKNVPTSSVSNSQNEIKQDSFRDEYSRETRQKYPNSFVRDQSKTKNLRNTECSRFRDQHLDTRSGRKDYSYSRVKSNKYKPESKFVGHAGKFENKSAADTYARDSHKDYESKPSPKRNLSDPVKSVDTSSSTSKTVEFNSPDDDVWGDYEDTGIAWNLDGNDNLEECKSSVLEKETDWNKVSHPPDSSIPVKTDCDTSSEKLCHQILELKIAEEFPSGSCVKEHNIDINEEGGLISSGGLVDRSDNNKNAIVIDDQKSGPNDPVANTDVDNTDTGNNNYSENEMQQPTSDVINTTSDSGERKNFTDTATNEIITSICEAPNSEGVTVQSTESEQISSKLPDNLEQADVEAVQEKSSLKDASISNNADNEMSTAPSVEKDAKTLQDQMKSLSSQSIKDDSKSALKSTDIVSAESQTPKHEENIENSSCALNLSDDGGWSTVSEDENNDA